MRLLAWTTSLFIWLWLPLTAQTTIDFDDAGKWTAGSGSITSYQNDHTYVSDNWTFTGGPALRQGNALQDGVPGALGTYSWRLRDAICTWTATYNTAGTIATFSFRVRRWDNDPNPNWTVSYSTNGTSFTTVGTINNSFLGNSSDWATFTYTFSTPVTVGANQFIVQIGRNSGERIMIDDFTFSSSVPSPEITTAPSTISNLSYSLGNGPSAAQAITVTGSSLSPASGNITLTGSINYEVSADNSTYSSSVSLPYTAGNLSTTVYVRLKAGLPIATYNNETISLSGGGATTANITCNGQVTAVVTSPVFINEFSNGAGGNQEYIELVVDGGGCTVVDIRGLIIDDNNGLDNSPCQGFGSTSTGSGVAYGHYRFGFHPQWAAVPSGSIIVVYVDADPNTHMPADDIDDTNPHDSVYVVPLRSSVMDIMTGFPHTQSAGADCGYSGGTYQSPPTDAFAMTFANTGDAAQVRYPNGDYLHGLSYGSSPMTGGPGGLHITAGTGSQHVYSFSSGDPHDVANWSEGVAAASGSDETPGAPNNPSNAAFLGNLATCILLDLPEEVTATCSGNHLQLQWTATATATPPRAVQWLLRQGHTISTQLEPQGQQARVAIPADATAWRWGMADYKGKWTYANWEEVPCMADNDWQIVLTGGSLHTTAADSHPILLYNSMGQLIAADPMQVDTTVLPAGWYLVRQGMHTQPVWLP